MIGPTPQKELSSFLTNYNDPFNLSASPEGGSPKIITSENID